jgi:hypothetical protein
VSAARLEAFSDGVFAVAITLLALDLRVDGPGHVGVLPRRGTSAHFLLSAMRAPRTHEGRRRQFGERLHTNNDCAAQPMPLLARRTQLPPLPRPRWLRRACIANPRKTCRSALAPGLRPAASHAA